MIAWGTSETEAPRYIIRRSFPRNVARKALRLEEAPSMGGLPGQQHGGMCVVCHMA